MSCLVLSEVSPFKNMDMDLGTETGTTLWPESRCSFGFKKRKGVGGGRGRGGGGATTRDCPLKRPNTVMIPNPHKNESPHFFSKVRTSLVPYPALRRCCSDDRYEFKPSYTRVRTHTHIHTQQRDNNQHTAERERERERETNEGKEKGTGSPTARPMVVRSRVYPATNHRTISISAKERKHKLYAIRLTP